MPKYHISKITHFEIFLSTLSSRKKFYTGHRFSLIFPRHGRVMISRGVEPRAISDTWCQLSSVSLSLRPGTREIRWTKRCCSLSAKLRIGYADVYAAYGWLLADSLTFCPHHLITLFARLFMSSPSLARGYLLISVLHPRQYVFWPAHVWRCMGIEKSEIIISYQSSFSASRSSARGRSIVNITRILTQMHVLIWTRFAVYATAAA